jgi:flagellar basal-body rod protein FlgC
MPDPIKAPSLLPLPSGGNVRPMFRSLGISGSGLSVQRQRMETIAQNIANADVTRGADGQPYKRRDVVAETATSQNAMFGQQGAGVGGASAGGAFSMKNMTNTDGSVDGIKSIEVPFLPLGSSLSGTGPDVGEYGVRVAGIAEDQGEGRLVYEPGHPDANESGYVRYPDIDTTQELVKLMDAKRIYEANAAVFQTTKSILRAALDI